MRSPAARGRHSRQGSGKHLPLTRNFHPRFDDIANTGDANAIAGMDDGE